jgi:hypothetical protein
MAEPIDEDALFAAVDLVSRTGAKGFEIGYLHDDVPTAKAGWYAHAQYRGARITCADQPHPIAAAEGLARRLLSGGKCVHCGRLISLNPAGAYARDATLIDGSPWLVEQQISAGICPWRRDGRTWVRGCEQGRPPIDAPTRRERRAARRKGRR